MSEQNTHTHKTKTNGYSHKIQDARKAKRRQEAFARQAQWDALPVNEKLKRMGKKQRAKWDKKQAGLAATKTPAKVEVKVETALPVVEPAKAPKTSKSKKAKVKKA